MVKMKIALTQACLKVKCCFRFYYCRRQSYSRNQNYQNIVLEKAFCTPCFFSKKRAVLRSLPRTLFISLPMAYFHIANISSVDSKAYGSADIMEAVTTRSAWVKM